MKRLLSMLLGTIMIITVTPTNAEEASALVNSSITEETLITEEASSTEETLITEEASSTEESTTVEPPMDFAGCEAAVVASWENYETIVDITPFNIKRTEVFDVYSKIIELHSEYFYVNQSCLYLFYEGSIYASDIENRYLGTREEIEEKRAKFSQAVDGIIALVDKNWSDVDKCLFLHDYIASNNIYDLSVYTGVSKRTDDTHTSYGCLVENFSVCEGISSAFMYLARLLGIEVYAVKSAILSHEWNMVKIGDYYYHIDITWDSPVILNDDNNYYNINGYVFHTSFLKNDKQMAEMDYTDWKAPYLATEDAPYNEGFWDNASTQFVFFGKYQYFVSEGKLKRRDTTTAQISTLYTINDELWFAKNSREYHWKGITSRICANYDKDFIVFSGAQCFYLYNLKNDSIVSVFRSASSTGYIFGSAVRNDKLFYDLKDLDSKGNSLYLTSKIANFTFPDINIMFGDTDSNGSVDAIDLLRLRKYLANIEDTIDKESSDVYNNGKIDAGDAITLLRIISGK